VRNNTITGISQEGDLGVRSVDLGVDASALVHLMSILTDLYSDPTATVIREYASNARDSHIAAGNDDPIIVTLPSTFDPTYVVRDHGVGLSEDDLEYVCALYGASTKRDNDEETGMLGLGFKSALAYTGQFTVVGVKNGVKSTAVLSRKENGSGKLDFLPPTLTDEPNGVEVRIPVDNHLGDFNHKARTFFQYWKPGTVLVDGEELSLHTQEDGLWLSDDVLIVESQDYRHTEDIVVMGGVSYPVRSHHALTPQLRRGYAVVWVPMGSVSFPPAREELTYSPQTEATLDKARQFIADRLDYKVRSDIETAASHYDALQAFSRWAEVIANLARDKFVYRGEQLPWNIRFGEGDENKAFHFANSYRGNDGSATTREYIKATELERYIYVVNHTNRSLPATNRAKLKLYCEEHGINYYQNFIFCKEYTGGAWGGPDIAIIDFADVRQVQLPREERAGSRKAIRGSYYVKTGTFGVNEEWVEQLELDAEKPIIYFHPNEVTVRERRYSTRKVHTKLTAIEKLYPEATLVRIVPSRTDKLLRDYPDAMTLTQAARAYYATWVAGLTAADYRVLSGAKAHVSFGFRKLIEAVGEGATIEDPELRAALNRKVEPCSDPNPQKVLSWLRELNSYVPEPEPAETEAPVDLTDTFEDRYPLVEAAGYRLDATHLIEYVNAMYVYRNTNTEEN
jgi:hypothetical protein